MSELTTTTFASNGQVLVHETPELLADALVAFRTDLAETPAWTGAPNPTDEFLTMFLRAEVFIPSMAAKRYRRFWEMKVELWGEETAALPLKVENERGALDSKFFQIVPGARDREERQEHRHTAVLHRPPFLALTVVQVVFVDVGARDQRYDVKENVRAVWYVMLAALEDVETQRRGVCIISSMKTVKPAQVNVKFIKTVLRSIQGAIPLRFGSMNLCYPPVFFRVVWSLVNKFMAKRLKKRVRVIPGPDSSILPGLDPVVTPANVPSVPMLGEVELDFAAWLDHRFQAGK
ncbi:unnamed protein product [Choristocarpus tenellus]